MSDDRRIGVFDSGVGGLTVARAILDLLPTESLLYIGDTARVPYGPRPLDEVRGYAAQAIEVFRLAGVKLAVIACNTSVSAGIEGAADRSLVPVIGVLDPGAKAAADLAARWSSAGGPRRPRVPKIAVIATEGTVRSGSYPEALRRHGFAGEVIQRACPRFVLMAESGETATSVARQAVAEDLAEVAEANPDILVLGCTHFPHLGEAIAAAIGPRTAIIDPAKATARAVAAFLTDRRQLASGDGAPRSHRFLISGDREAFRRVGETFFGRPIEDLDPVDLERFSPRGDLFGTDRRPS